MGAVILGGCGGASATSVAHSTARTPSIATTSVPPPAPRRAAGPPPAPRRHAGPPFAVGLRVVTFVDHSRMVRLPRGAAEPRKLVTIVRYPAAGPVRLVDVRDARPARAAGPFPLVVFGHGFAVTPRPYAALLRAWARAGYVVAAPIFPLENADAPGGPNEADLINQPRDMSAVITGMTSAGAARRGLFAGLVDRGEVAVSGQSDGGETALAVAYDPEFLDRRVRAAAILSGATIPGVGGFDFPARARPYPPLLATQGTADTINPPSFTSAFFDPAPAPKYRLTMFGAPHLGPYTDEQPQLGVVERVTTAFFDRYLKRIRGALRRMIRAGDVPGTSHLAADQGQR